PERFDVTRDWSDRVRTGGVDCSVGEPRSPRTGRFRLRHLFARGCFERGCRLRRGLSLGLGRPGEMRQARVGEPDRKHARRDGRTPPEELLRPDASGRIGGGLTLVGPWLALTIELRAERLEDGRHVYRATFGGHLQRLHDDALQSWRDIGPATLQWFGAAARA